MILNLVLHKAAAEGDIEPFNASNQNLNRILTPIKNIILHIHIISPSRTPKKTQFVKKILEIYPPLLLQVNVNGDTPLNLAAKYGNNKGNTALHEAVRNARLNVVEIVTKEDPEFSYFGNDSGETPLYIAVERKCPLIAAKILETCKSAAHEGPDGKTALHAAVMRHDLDQNGWTPLHYAEYYGCFHAAEWLLKSDNSAAYIVDKDRKMTALNLAAGQWYSNIMEAIIFQCPDCCELVDKMGWNFLRFAMTVKSLNNFLRNRSFTNIISNF
ncbi:hypothetical protein Pint_05712 [Pistacia integerrima]|uniref:Uncharacterized protein n=1 Tax=Pistacia integerrima TaxID=434235 RepID=A0ACC0Z5A7_9ROSI|nr:hypothetical protein Pint_05712 [Pistacia integerrima]